MEMIHSLPMSIHVFIMIALAMIRIFVFFGLTAVLRKNLFNVRVLTAFSIMIAYCTYQKNNFSHSNQSFDFITLGLSASSEIANGFIYSFVVSIAFEIFKSLGQMVSLWSGMSAAAIIDPSLGSVTDLSKYFVFLSVLIFFLINGHLQVLYAISESFHYFPIGHFVLSGMNDYHVFVSQSMQIFSTGLLLSMPVLITMMLVNLSMALASRFSSQISIFSVGIPLLIISGIFWMYITYDLMITSSIGVMSHMIDILVASMMGKWHV